MNILFIGTVDFSKKTLQKLVDLNATIVGIITKKESAFNSDFADLSPIAHSNNIPIHYGDDLNSKETLSWIENLSPDIIFCFGWSSLLKKQLLSIPKMGVVGFHPAALPQNRGRHPIIWALVLGLSETASTFFFMDENADSGPILSQTDITIKDHDNAQSLYKKVEDAAIKQIEAFLPQLSGNSFQAIVQDSSKANYWRKRGKNDGKIDWRMSSNAIYNLVRALSKPYVGAHVEMGDQQVKIWKVKEVSNSDTNIEPGKVLKSDKISILVKCYGGAIEILEHDFNTLPLVNTYLN